MNLRRGRGLAAFAAVVLLVATSVALVASAAPAPRALKYACASNLYNAKKVLHYVSRPSQCTGSRKTLVKFASDYPVYVCRKEHGGFASAHARRRFPYPVGIRNWGPAGLIRLVSAPSKCAPPSQPNETAMTLPASSSRLFCAAKKGGELRWVQKVTQCDRKEFPVKLAKRTASDENEPMVPADDSATTDENSSTNVDVLANDRGSDAVDQLDTTGTTGTVTINSDNTIKYDPAGKFETLKVGQTATDTFKYTGKKGTRQSAAATVTVTITGVNDAPVAQDDSATTDENTAKSIAVLGNDTDVEGDSLSVGSVDLTGTVGSATIGGGGVNYDPTGKFDSLQAGQTATDSFKYKANDGSANSGTATVSLTITGVNDAPVLSGTESTKLNYLEGSAGTPVSPGVSVADPDNANVHSATVKIGTGFDTAHDELGFSDQNGISGTYATATGVLTLTGSATKANYQTALRSVRFDSAGGPSGDRTVSFQIEDGEPLDHDSNVASRVVTVDKAPVASPDSPTIDEDSGANTIDVLANDSDGGDGGPKTIESKSDGAHGAVAITNNGADLTYTPAANYCGTDSFDYTLNGGSNATVNVTVTCLNDAPVNTVPGAQTVNEDSNIQFSNDFSIADVDAASDSIQTTLAVPNGTITVSGGGPAVVTTNGTSSVQITGSLTDVNSKLSAVTYAPDANVNGSRTLTMDTDDQGHNGSGGSKTDHDTVDITISAVNDAPVNTMPGAQTVDEDTTLVFTPSPSVDDVDAGAGGVKVTVGVDHGTLTLSGTGGLTFSAGDGTNDATMTFTGTVSQVNAALLGLAYKGNLDYNGSDTLHLTTDDEGRTGLGGAGSDTDTTGITVNAVNDAPLNSVPGTQTPAEDSPVTFSGANAFSTSDVDVAGSDLKITLSASHGAMTLSGTSGLVFSTGDGTDDTQMIFTGTQSAVNTALNGLTFTPAPNYNGLAQIELKTEDQGATGSGGNQQDDDIVDLNYGAVNDAPVNSVPGGQTVNEDSTLTFSSGGGNALSTSDVDAGSDAVQVTLSALHGTLTVTPLSGLTFSTGDGTNDATMTFSGSLTDVNAALGGASYTGNADYNGPETLTLKTDDLGHNGSGGAKSDTDTVAITVNAVNDAPVATGDSYSTDEDTPLSVVTPGVLGNDSDVDGNTITAQLVTGPANATSFTLNSDGSFSYTPNADFHGSDSFTYKANDGSLDSNTVTVDITVNSVNDAPVNSVPGTQTINEDTQLVLSGGNAPSITDVDSGTDNLRVTLGVSQGKLTLSSTTNLSVTGDGTASIVATGSRTDLNTALDGLKYDPAGNFDGIDTITVDTSDLGHNGSGGTKTDSDSINVNVTAVNDGPVNSVPGSQSTDEDTSLTFSSANSNKLSFDDSDSATDDLTITVTTTNGTSKLNPAATGALTSLSGDGSASISATGTEAELNAALDGLVFSPTADYFGPASVELNTNDNGHNGTGGALSDDDTVTVTVNSVNDAPVVFSPATQSTPEDTQLTFSPVPTVTDADSGANDVRVSLSVGHGTLTLATTVGITSFSQGDGNGDAAMTFDAPISAVNSALNGLKYDPDADFGGAADGFHISVSDLGHNGSGGTLTDDADTSITVGAVNDAPVVDLNGASPGTGTNPTFLETTTHDNSVTLAPSATVTDVDDNDIKSATVTLTQRPDSPNEGLAATGTANITVDAYDSSTGVLFLHGVAPKSEYASVLQTVTYSNSTTIPNPADRPVTFTVRDPHDLDSASATSTVKVVPLNSPPVLDLDSTNAGSFDSEATFTEDSPAVNIAPNTDITDVDAFDTHMESATITLENRPDGANEVLTTDPSGSGITVDAYDSSTGVLFLHGHGLIADYETFIDHVKYGNASQNPDTTDRTIHVVVNDGQADSLQRTATVHVNRHNDPIQNTVPGGQTFDEDTSRTFNTANSNLISIADADAGSGAVKVTISADHGSLSASTPSGGTRTGDGTHSLELTGTVSAVNTSLDGITYTPDSNFNSGDTITVLSDDQGNTGGPATADSDTIAITLNAVNDAPSNTVPGSQTVNEDTNLVFSSGNSNQISVADIDAGTDPIKVKLEVSHGAITLSGTAGLAFSIGDGTGDATMEFTGTITNINNALNGAFYLGTLDYNGPDTLTVTTNDQGHNGTGGAQSDVDTVGITVNPVNDAPSATADSGYSTNEDVTLTVPAPGVLGNDTDIDSGTLHAIQVTGPAHASSFTLNDDGSFSYSPAANYNGPDSFTYKANDGSLDSNTVTVSLTVTAVNDAPSNSVPGAQSVDEDTTLTFNSGNGNALSTNDVDSGASPIRVTLSVNHGGVTLGSTAGLTFVCGGCTGDGSGDPTMTFEGTLANVQAALNGLSYLGTLNYNGPDTLTLTVNDKGNTGSGGALQDVDTVAITVNPVNDAPVAGDETFDATNSAIGNTTLNVNDTAATGAGAADGRPPTPDPTDTSPTTDRPHKEITGNIFANDTDVDNNSNEFTATPGTFATNDGGTVTIQSDGDFNFEPAPSTSCVDNSDFFDYTLSDNVSSGAGPNPGTDTGRVTIAITGCVWYVNNNDAQGNSGTSEKPFDTTAQAQTASNPATPATIGTTFVYDGDDTTTGYNTGYTMNSGESLISEGADLKIGSDTLHTADSANRATLTNNNADVVSLNDGATVKGLNIDPQGTGGGICGGTACGGNATAGGTLDNVNITDNGTKGTQPALELNGTTGTFNVSNLTVSNGDGSSATSTDEGVKLNNAGTVNFASAGANQISTNGAAGLDAANTNLGTASVFDGIIVQNSGSGGVSLTNTTGSTTSFGDGAGTDLSLTTTVGATPAFNVQTAGSFNIPSTGSADVSATGGPAVDVVSSSGSTMPFDSVSSTNSANDGVNIDGIGTGTFSATNTPIPSAIGGEAGIGFDLNGGSGAITYPGTFNNGSGSLAAEVTGRTGGVVSLSGSMNDTSDAGGGVNIANNTGGSTVFSGATKQYNTGASDAVTFSSSNGHTFVLSGGGSDIDTTSGNGVNVTDSGTFQVSGSGNTIDSTALAAGNRALNIADTDIASSDVTFDHINASGGTNGIRLNNNTNSAGGLTVTGTGGTCDAGNQGGCSGGVIQSATGAGIDLASSTGQVDLTRMNVKNGGDDGIHASSVGTSLGNGIAVNNSVVTGNGNAAFESGFEYDDVLGVSSINSTVSTGNFHDNADIASTTGTGRFTVSGSTFSSNSSTGGSDGMFMNPGGSGSMLALIQNSTFNSNRDDGYQLKADGDSNMDLTFNNNTVNAAGNAGAVSAHSAINFDSNTTSDVRLSMTGGNVSSSDPGIGGSALIINPIGNGSTFSANLDNVTVGTAGVNQSGSATGHGIWVEPTQSPTVRVEIANSHINGAAQNGIQTLVNGGGSDVDVTYTGNTIRNVQNEPFLVQAGGVNTDTVDVCADIGGSGGDNTNPPGNDFAGQAPGGLFDVFLNRRTNSPSAHLKLANFAGGSGTAAATAYIQGRNVGNPTTFNNGADLEAGPGTCVLPTAPTLP